VQTEAERTRVRRRAVEDRWLPRLEDRLHTLDAELDEQERAEATSRRRGLRR
jgi:vacuolar-type H+-ATPase subunit D/Vma8